MTAKKKQQENVVTEPPAEETETAEDAAEATDDESASEEPSGYGEYSADFSVHADDDGFRGSARDGPLGDLASRLLRVGAEAVTQTTERLREAGEEVRPRDLVSGAVRMTAKGREELVGMVAREVRLYLEKLRVGEELRGLMTDHSLEINASVRLKPLTQDDSGDPGDPEGETPTSEAEEGQE